MTIPQQFLLPDRFYVAKFDEESETCFRTATKQFSNDLTNAKYYNTPEDALVFLITTKSELPEADHDNLSIVRVEQKCVPLTITFKDGGPKLEGPGFPIIRNGKIVK